MTDDDEVVALAGEFPPGLESLRAEIERLASGQRHDQDIRTQLAALGPAAKHSAAPVEAA
jgi:hypothetical protein